jgi:hypothetical protein
MSEPINLTEAEIEALKYPTGRVQFETEYTAPVVDALIKKIEEFPLQLNNFAQKLKTSDLLYRYRPGSWTVQQIIHHIADSHSNGLNRTKLALTEDNPTIKPYDENLFAALPDSAMPLDASILILNGVHARWSTLLRSMKTEDFAKTYFHPENKKTWSIAQLISIYAWHGEHHLAQIRVAIDRKF